MLSFQDRLSIKAIVATVISLVAIPYYFIAGGSLLGFILVRLAALFLGFCSQIGWHRWLTHNSFQPTAIGRGLMYAGMITTGIGRPIELVVGHRYHHVNSDNELDPHSPAYLSFWKMWLGRYRSIENPRPPRDLMRNKEAMWYNDNYWKIFWVVNIVLCLIDLKTALIFIPVSVAYSCIIIASVNYFGHRKGSTIAPRNTGPVLAFLAGGEGLHLNHHLRPNDASFSANGEFDVGHRVVQLLSWSR